MTALHFAAERGDAAMTEMLVYAGANVAAVTRIGQYTPLHLASRAGNAGRRAGAVEGRRQRRRRGPRPAASRRCISPPRPAAPRSSTLLLDHGADANAERIRVGTDAADVRRRGEPRRRDPRAARARRRRDASRPRPSTSRSSRRSIAPPANVQRKVLEASVAKGQQPTPRQVQAAIEASRELFASGKIPPPEEKPAAGRGGRGGGDDANAANSFNPEEINPPVSNKGGMTALLHAARQGHLEAARALLDGGAPIDQVGSGDATSPLLMAVINGEFDLAMFLIERGANAEPRRRRQRRDAALGRRQHAVAAAHALSAAAGDGAAEGDLSRRDEGAARQGRRSRRAAQDASLVSGLQRLRQPQLRPRRHRGLDRVLARGLRHRPRGDEAARRARRRSQHPDRRAQRRRYAAAAAAPPAGAGGADRADRRREPGEVQRPAGARGRTRRARDSRRRRRRVRRRLRRQRPSPRARMPGWR